MIGFSRQSFDAVAIFFGSRLTVAEPSESVREATLPNPKIRNKTPRANRAAWGGNATSSTMMCRKLVCYYNQQADTGTARIDQVVVTIDVINIYIVVIVPLGRPRFGILEIITAVIKAAIATLHVEMM
jgi:hypothetical protein